MKKEKPFVFTDGHWSGWRIKKGYYYDFITSDTEYPHDEYGTKRYCFKCIYLKTAINRMMKRLSLGGIEFIDYEVEVLDKNKCSTGVFINLRTETDSEIVKYLS